MQKLEYKKFGNYINDLLVQLALKQINTTDDNIRYFYKKLEIHIIEKYNNLYEELILKRGIKNENN